MNSLWLYEPVIFFGKRIYILFTAVMSIPVWLAAHAYLESMRVHDDEAAATAVAMCFFAAIFTGRYIAGLSVLHVLAKSRKLTLQLALFIVACFCWLFIHADLPIKGWAMTNLLLFWSPFLTMSLAIGILIKLVRTQAEKELVEARSAAAKSESELRLLQSQLSPHFLFNTLNNLYGLSLSQHQKVPPLLLRLSDLLRYTVYEANKAFVPLADEVAYIRNYIEFEKVRLGDRLSLQADIDTPAQSDLQIAPMLLIVFIENAFKHSKNTADDKISISISIRVWNNRILFSVANSRGLPGNRLGGSSGFGLDNVRKRLDLLYAGAYKLDIEEDARTYSVTLQLEKR